MWHRTSATGFIIITAFKHSRDISQISSLFRKSFYSHIALHLCVCTMGAFFHYSLNYQARPTYGEWQFEHLTTLKLQIIKLLNTTNSDTHTGHHLTSSTL